ncbi:hypothetical protein V8B97DRAFT_406932 [Scleroderma yunnanense]
MSNRPHVQSIMIPQLPSHLNHPCMHTLMVKWCQTPRQMEAQPIKSPRTQSIMSIGRSGPFLVTPADRHTLTCMAPVAGHVISTHEHTCPKHIWYIINMEVLLFLYPYIPMSGLRYSITITEDTSLLTPSIASNSCRGYRNTTPTHIVTSSTEAHSPSAPSLRGHRRAYIGSHSTSHSPQLPTHQPGVRACVIMCSMCRRKLCVVQTFENALEWRRGTRFSVPGLHVNPTCPE